MDWVILAVAVLTLGVAAVGSWYAFASDRRNSERSDVQWQVSRKSQGVFRVLNVGNDPAYEVRAEAWDKYDLESKTADKLERFEDLTITLPTRAEIGPDETDVPTPLTLSLPEEPPTDMPDFLRPPPTHPIIEQMRDNARQQHEELVRSTQQTQVSVKVVWRSKRGRWSDWTSRTG